MIEARQINSVSKNNFLSLMESYEINYTQISKFVDLENLNPNVIGRSFISNNKAGGKKLLLFVESISNHTVFIKFSYNYFSDEEYVSYVDLKIFLDSKQVEIIHSNELDRRKPEVTIQKFHTMRITKWYKNYFLSLWLNNCIENGYSFDMQSEV